jgi:hypothetical protein
MAAERVLPEMLLDENRQSVEAFAHIGYAGCQPYPYAGGWCDHPRSTLMMRRKVFADDTTLPVLDPGRGWTKTGRLWCYAVDDRPWAGPTHPVAAYVYAEDRKGSRAVKHLATFRGVLQVDGYDGFERLALDRADSSVTLAFCWAHMRRDFYDFWVSTKSPLAAWVLAKAAEHRRLRSEVVLLSKLCTPGCRSTSDASRPPRISPRPFAMRSDIGPALPYSWRTVASRWIRMWLSGPSGRMRRPGHCAPPLQVSGNIGT